MSKGKLFCDPKTEIYFPPTKECVKKMTSKPMSIEETATYGGGAVLLGAFAGWIFGRQTQDLSEKEFASEMEKDEIIQEYHLNDFIPDFTDIDLDYLSEKQLSVINSYISQGTISRLEQVEDEEDFSILVEDLNVLQNLVKSSDNPEINVVSDHLNVLQDNLNFYEYIDDMMVAISELTEVQK